MRSGTLRIQISTSSISSTITSVSMIANDLHLTVSPPCHSLRQPPRKTLDRVRKANQPDAAAVQDIILARLEKEGLKKIRLPLGTSSDKPHVPIFASTNVWAKSRVIVIFGDTSQMLGALAMRVANGCGGIDKGSLVTIVREINNQRCSPNDKSSPGIIIANPSELWWWPEGKRALDIPRRNRVPMTSAVHLRRLDDDRVNRIPQNENPLRHTEYMFKHVFGHLIREDAKIDIIGIGNGSDPIGDFLDRQENWVKYAAQRLNALVLLGGYSKFDSERGQGFKEFLERVCYHVWTNSPTPLPQGLC